MKKYTITKLACYLGYIVQAVINNFLPILFVALQDEYGLSYEKLAGLIAINFFAQITVDILSPAIIKLLGYRITAVLAQFTAALGLALMGVLPSVMAYKYLSIVIPAVIYAVGSGLMEVILSPIIEMLPTDNKAGNMSILHSFYCWGQAFTIVVTTALCFYFGYHEWYKIPLIWAVIPFINMFSFFFVPIVEPEPEQRDSGLTRLLTDKYFYIFMLMMLCAGASEIAMSQWASLFAQRALGVTKVIGDLAGPCAFAVLMGTGRVLYAFISKKVQFEKLIILLSALCFGTYLTVALCHIPFVALICCAFCGFTVSIFWPGTFSLGAKRFPKGSSAMFGIFAMCGDTGCCLGPFLLGMVADKSNLNTGILAASVFPVFMIVLALILIKNNRCKTDK